jgi:hypothetical protein
MQSFRAREFDALQAWLDQNSAAVALLFDQPDDVSASEGALLRLLLAGSACGGNAGSGGVQETKEQEDSIVGNGGLFNTTLVSLEQLQGEGKSFRGLSELAAAVRVARGELVAQQGDLLAWLVPSGLLLADDASEGDKHKHQREFRAWVDLEGPRRVRNELVALQQASIAGTGPASFGSLAELLDALRQRRAEALQSVRSFFLSDAGRACIGHPDAPSSSQLDEAQVAALLHAVVDAPLLPEAVAALASRGQQSHFADVPLLDVALRRLVHGTAANGGWWSIHEQVESAVLAGGLLSQQPRALRLSYFDTAYMRSQVEQPDVSDEADCQRALLDCLSRMALTAGGRIADTGSSTEEQPPSSGYPSVEALVEEVALALATPSTAAAE